MELGGKRVVVVGLGRSGIAAARLCVDRGAQVTGTDSRDVLPEAAMALRREGVHLVLGGHAGVPFNDADLVVVSPGVPDLGVLRAAEARGVEVIGELELACRFFTQPIVTIGGTNGKSTTTTLVQGLLVAGGLKTFAGGNLGVPPSEAVGQPWDVLVLEVSSFQLERAPRLAPKVSLLLNISEDHLDRYESFRDYAVAKGNAFANQSDTDIAIIPAGDELCRGQAARGRGKLVTFGAGGDYEVRGRRIVERASGHIFSVGGAALHGRHNLLNLAAAAAAARALSVGWSAIARGTSQFEPLPHRMALVRSLAGVNYYDDSKGTNVGASVTAVAGLTEDKCVLIAGGRDKLGDYGPLVRALKDRGRALVVLGEAADRIARAAAGCLPVEHASSMAEAVQKAFRLAQSGDAVLLSPACSSFDMFSGYHERGEVFGQEVLKLTPELKS